MNDKELVDRCVALWVLEWMDDDEDNPTFLSLTGTRRVLLLNDDIDMQYFVAVRDWRVAGALMEMFGNNHDRLMKMFIRACAMMVCVPPRGPFSRAITEACCEELS